MGKYTITYLVRCRDVSDGSSGILEEASRLAGRGHDIRLLSLDRAPEGWRSDIPFTRVDGFTRDSVPESDFVIATLADHAQIARDLHRGVPILYVGVHADSTSRLADGAITHLTSSRDEQVSLLEEGGISAHFVPTAIQTEVLRDEPSQADPVCRIRLSARAGAPGAELEAGRETEAELRRRGYPVECVEGPEGARDGCHVFLGSAAGPNDGVTLPALRAMAAGLPTVLTDIPAHRAIAPGDAHAMFVPPSDPIAMADAIERIIREPHLAHGLRKTGAAVAARYDWDTRLDRLEAVLDSLRAGRPHPPLDERLRTQQYEFAAGMAKGLDVLDVGCGTGAGSMLLAESGATSVIGIDRSPTAIERASRDNRRANMRFERASLRELYLPAGTLGLVVALDPIRHERHAREVIYEAARVLHTKGAVVMAVQNPGTVPGGDDPGLALEETSSIDDLRSLLEDTFGHVVLFAQRMVDGKVVLAAESIDPANDLAYVVMAARPQRAPIRTDAERDDSAKIVPFSRTHLEAEGEAGRRKAA